MISIFSQNLNLKSSHSEKRNIHTYRHRRIVYPTFPKTKCSLGNWIKLLGHSQQGLHKNLANIRWSLKFIFFFCLQSRVCIMLLRVKKEFYMQIMYLYRTVLNHYQTFQLNHNTAYLHIFRLQREYRQPQGVCGLTGVVNRWTDY